MSSARWSRRVGPVPRGLAHPLATIARMPAGTGRLTWMHRAYTGLLVLLLVSMPIGVTLAWAAIGYFGIVDLGLGRALTHAVATRLGSDREDELIALGWTALALMFLLGTVGALVLAAVTPWMVNDLLKIPDALAGETARSFYLLAASLPIVVSTAGPFATHCRSSSATSQSNPTRVPRIPRSW